MSRAYISIFLISYPAIVTAIYFKFAMSYNFLFWFDSLREITDSKIYAGSACSSLTIINVENIALLKIQ